ncbi:MAG: HlyD family efflux transporter periplasmic adaptor subunit [Bacteroidales bacterium]|nr:HlyD family efflux transporter periplasmic adaptor subunit [Bacteroidales bacterium]
MEEKNKIEIRSEEVQEILGHIPSWMVRSGISAIFVVIIVLLIGSWFFKYPDVIQSNIIITTENPPAELVAKTNGRIEHLFVKDSQNVQYNQLLAVIENPANFNDIIFIDKTLDSLKPLINIYDTSVIQFLIKDFEFGEIQSFFSSFLKAYTDYKNLFELNYYPKKIESVNEQIAMSHLYYDHLSLQRNILEKEYQIAKKDFERSKHLFEQKVISDVEFENSESVLLQKQYAFEGSQSTLANTKIQIANYKQSILELELNFNDEQNRMQMAISESYNNLKAQLSVWKQKYMLKAPIKGIITFNRYWSVNQNVIAGENVFTIIPLDSTKIIGKLDLPLAGSGKVKTGQIVNIKFISYPHMEYGMVKGIVSSISLVPNDQTYLVEVELPEGLLTNYGKQLKFSQEMFGNAEIITENLRLSQRILNPIISLIKKNH